MPSTTSLYCHHPKCKRRRTIRTRLRSSNSIGFGWLALGLLAVPTANAQFDPYFRWGQASSLSGSTLLVHGGKVDTSNSYSYTSAPNSNDLFSLDLSIPFNVSEPNWVYVSGSQDPSSSQGPAVAFHSLTVYSNKRALLFGGDGGPNLPIQTNADSAWQLDIAKLPAVTWTAEPANWAEEPMRRMYHSAAVSGKNVWITGGQKADGSGLAFPETYVFDSSGPHGLFNSVSAEGASLPVDLVGHRSVVLPSGALVVVGGYSPSRSGLMSMSTLWVLDTTAKDATWSNITIQGQTPSPRRNFALALLDGNRILIHGGGDGTLQNLYADGAILNMQMSPISWTSAEALVDGVGARADHMAVGIGSSVLFGFGRSPNGPAPAGLSLYDSNSNSFGSSYSPPSSGPISQTVGGPGATTTIPGYTTGASWPTSAASGLIPGQSSAHGIGATATPSPTPMPTGGVSDAEGSGHRSRVTAIAVGTVLGASALIGALLVGLCWYYRRRNGRRGGRMPWLSGDRRHLIVGSGDTEDPVLPGGQAREKIPVVGTRLSDPPRARGLMGLLPMSFQKSEPTALAAEQRFNMLHDEDARSFGHFGGGTSAGTTMSTPVRPAYRRLGSSTRHIFSEMINASTTSFKAALGFTGAADLPATPGANPGDKGSPDWWDKSTADPFDSTAPALSDLPTVTAIGIGYAARQRGGDGGQYPSISSGSSGTRDPFSDSAGHSRTSTAASRMALSDSARQDSYHPFLMPLDDPPPKSHLISPNTSPPPIDTSVRRNMPYLGVITPGTLASSDGSHPGFPFTPTSETAISSTDRSTSPFYGASSLLGGAPTTPMKRSDSWWARFGRSSLSSLSRTGSAGDRLNPIRRLSLRNSMTRSPTEGYAALDFRDPNPAPRLAGIEETGKSGDPSPESANAKKNSSGEMLHANVANLRGLHSKSQSSMQTADSEALERMGRRMDVIQRNRTASSDISLTPDPSIMEDWESSQGRRMTMQPNQGSMSSMNERPQPVKQSSSASGSGFSGLVESPSILTPPSGTQETYQTAQTHLSRPAGSSPSESFKTAPSVQPPPLLPPPRKRTSNAITGRIATFEHMTSPPTSPLGPGPAEGSSAPPHGPEKGHGRRTSVGAGVRYGLTERAPLFVANPDRRSGTGSTTDSVSPPAS